MIHFILIVNKQGQTLFSKYYDSKVNYETRQTVESELVRKCLYRTKNQCSFIEYQQFKIIYRRYASLFFIFGADSEENELATFEFIHCFVETLDFHFKNICELDVMFNLDKVYIIVDEFIANGQLVESCKHNVSEPLQWENRTT